MFKAPLGGVRVCSKNVLEVLCHLNSLRSSRFLLNKTCVLILGIGQSLAFRKS